MVITIEPAIDPDPAPDETHVLAGDIVDGIAELTISHPAALGTDFTSASGRYILGTPTDGDGNNELSGVWFIDLPLAQGLDVPALPAGWVYEGWAVIDGVPVTTGRFTDAAAADDFDGFSGDQGGPARSPWPPARQLRVGTARRHFLLRSPHLPLHSPAALRLSLSRPSPGCFRPVPRPSPRSWLASPRTPSSPASTWRTSTTKRPTSP